MTGGTFHQEGIVLPWRKVRFLFAPELIEQAAFATFGSVSLLGFQQSFFTQVVEGSADSGLGQFQLLSDGGDGRPALAIFVGMVGKVDIHRDCPVRQIPAVEKVKTAHGAVPLAYSEVCVCWVAPGASPYRPCWALVLAAPWGFSFRYLSCRWASFLPLWAAGSGGISS